MKKVIIHCIHRSGSTALCDVLSSKYNIQNNLYEPFINLRLDNFGNEPSLWINSNLKYNAHNTSSRTETIINNINVIKNTDKEYILKIIPTQISNYMHLLNNLPDVEYHFLYRENILDSVLSRCLAISRKIFNADTPTDYKKFKCTKKDIDDQILEFIELRKLFETNRYNKIHCYEKIKLNTNKFVKLTTNEQKIAKCSNIDWTCSYVEKVCNLNGFENEKFYIQ
jgi:hypothetical protein